MCRLVKVGPLPPASAYCLNCLRAWTTAWWHKNVTIHFFAPAFLLMDRKSKSNLDWNAAFPPCIDKDRNSYNNNRCRPEFRSSLRSKECVLKLASVAECLALIFLLFYFKRNCTDYFKGSCVNLRLQKKDTSAEKKC